MTDKTDPEFTKLLGEHIANAKGFYDYGIDRGLTTPEATRLTIVGRVQYAKELAAAGLSQRDIAKRIGVSQMQVSRDLKQNVSDSDTNGFTAATQTRIENAEKLKRLLAEPADVKLSPDFYYGDFRDLAHKIADDSIDLVLTDPPYDKESTPLYRDAAAHAARILKPGGSFIAYTGHQQLPEVLTACGRYLRFWWLIAGLHAGPTKMLDRLGVRVGWKPLVWFVKQTRGDVQNVFTDVLEGGGREKDDHEWQQSESEAALIIEKFTFEGGIVVDFFAGSGTTLLAAKRLNRRFIGFEKDENHAETIAERLKSAA